MSELEILKVDELDSVSGGMILDTNSTPEYDPNYPYEVLDNNNCKVLGKFPTMDAAVKYAKSFESSSYDTQQVDWATVKRLRTSPNVPSDN